jgi:hypothetical protein
MSQGFLQKDGVWGSDPPYNGHSHIIPAREVVTTRQTIPVCQLSVPCVTVTQHH